MRKSSRLAEIKPLFTLAVPVSLAHVATMAMQIVDTMFVGRLGADAIGAVSIGNAIFVTLMVLGIGVLFGLDYLVSHSFGAGQIDDCHHSLVQGLYLATFYSLPFMIIMYWASGWLGLLGVAPEVAAHGGAYLKWITWSLWPFLLFSAFRQYLQAMGVAGPVLLIMLAANAVNAFGNWVFIFGRFGLPAMGIEGSGLATCLARVFMLATIALYVIWRDHRHQTGLAKASKSFSVAKMKRLVKLGLPAGTQLLLEVGVFALSTVLAGRLGAVALAAHQIVLHIASVTFMVPLGLSAASAVRVGQALGRGERHRAVAIGWIAFGMGAAFMACSGVVFYVGARPLVGLFTTDTVVIETSVGLMLIAAFFQLFDGVQVVGTGVLRGVGDTRSSMLANLVGHWALGLPSGVMLCFSAVWGVKGLWVGLSVGLIAVSLALLWAWRRRAIEVLLAVTPRSFDHASSHGL